jgi:hypothetical protein
VPHIWRLYRQMWAIRASRELVLHRQPLTPLLTLNQEQTKSPANAGLLLLQRTALKCAEMTRINSFILNILHLTLLISLTF